MTKKSYKNLYSKREREKKVKRSELINKNTINAIKEKNK